MKEVDLQQTVDDLVSLWVTEEKLSVRPSLVTLWLLKCAGTTPTKAEEEAATELDPFVTLAAAGVADGCKLLAYVAKPAESGAAGALQRRELLGFVP
jgi:hypothetical protein